MVKKLLLATFFIVGMQLFEACWCGEDAPPYFDYASLGITPFEADSTRAPFDTMQAFLITPTELSYLAEIDYPSLNQAAWALSCPFPGENGPKYPITAIEISSDQPFNDTLPAGASLNTLFFYRMYSNAGYKAAALSDSQAGFDFNYDQDAILIGTPYLPTDLTLAHRLLVKITKSNGNVVEGSLSGVKFN